MNDFTKNYRVACNFARSLLSEGYIFVLEYCDSHRQSAFIKLKHSTNGNVIKISAQRNQWMARKNNKIIKLEQ